jgi:hypothetical protein
VTESGPQYPPPPAPGSNQIGQFEIGVSPIGTIPAFDVWTTVISQYANSPRLTAMITDMAAYFDFTKNFDDFFDLIWSVNTAQGYGLDIWGQIVGVERVLDIGIGFLYFGFNEATPLSAAPFNQGPFYSGQALTNNFRLTDDAYRVLILAKALANITDGSILSLNQILLSLFPGRGDAYVTDDGNMSMTYTFNFALTPVEAAIVTQSGVLPQPNGVTVSYVQNI